MKLLIMYISEVSTYFLCH